MLKAVFAHFRQPVLVVTDSWFGNDGLWSRLARGRDGDFQLLSRLRSNLTLYDLMPTPASGEPPRRGRPRKYGARLGSVAQCALAFRACAVTYRVLLYGKQRELLAFSQVVMLKTMKCPVRVVWVFRQSRYVALATTDLSLSCRADHRILWRALENRIRLQGNQAGHRQRQVPDAHRARRQQSSATSA